MPAGSFENALTRILFALMEPGKVVTSAAAAQAARVRSRKADTALARLVDYGLVRRIDHIEGRCKFGYIRIADEWALPPRNMGARARKPAPIKDPRPRHDLTRPMPKLPVNVRRHLVSLPRNTPLELPQPRPTTPIEMGWGWMPLKARTIDDADQ